jgi:sigma-E factor negative regulatory protein RseA
MTEKLSALMDGELDEVETESAFARLRANDDYRQQWSDFHLIGDALRGSPRLDSDLTARVMEALLDEPVVLAPPPRSMQRQSGLQRTFAIAASVAGVTLVTALAWSGRPGATAAAQVAKIPLEAQVPSQLASANLQEYLVAHQTHAPSAQGAAHYVKTVSMEAGGR